MTIINISSKDRESGSSSLGQIKLAFSLNQEYKIKEFIMPNNIYSIDSYNNKIYFNESSIVRIATLNSGVYSPTELSIEIKNQMDIGGINTYTITYNTNTNKFSFVSTANFGFTFNTNTTNSSYKLLGKNQVDDIEGLSQLSENQIDLNKHIIIYMNIPDANNDLTISNNYKTSFIISANTNFTDIIRKDYNNSNIILFFRDKSTIHYYIHDRDGNEINLNNADWDLLLEKV